MEMFQEPKDKYKQMVFTFDKDHSILEGPLEGHYRVHAIGNWTLDSK